MPSRETEALILRTYPYRESDLIVSFFTRDRGKLRGIARAARRPKSRFGSGLERLSHVRLFYFRRENQELARLDRCELLGPPVFLRSDYPASVALDFVVEVSEQLLPEHEPSDTYFRLLILVLEEMWAGLNGGSGDIATTEPASLVAAASQGSVAAGVEPSTGHSQAGSNGEMHDVSGWLWRSVTYFALWALRLGGWMPPLNVCVHSGVEIAPEETAYFARSQPGLFAADFRDRDSWPMSPASRAIANEMLRTPLPELRGQGWDRKTAEDLRRFLIQRLEAQFEQRLKTAAVLEQL